MIFYRSLRTVRALSFDLDDTLYDNRPVIVRLEQAMLDWLSEHHPATVGLDWRALRQQVLLDSPHLHSDVSLLRQRQLARGFALVGYNPAQAEQAAEQGMLVAHHWRNQVTVPQETHRVMTQLAARFPLVAVTNGNVDVEKVGLSHYFQAVLKAGEHGGAKPAADLFELASQTLAVDKANILHVGDHLRTDVSGANRHGLMSCWYNTTGQHLRQCGKARSLPTCEIRQLAHLLMLL